MNRNDKDQKIYDSTEIKIAQNQNQLSSSNRTLNSEKGNSQINLSIIEILQLVLLV